MSSRNLHEKPFTEETNTKLSIFEGYAKEWLPVFVMSNKKVCICDFFAGTGYDVVGVPGSPIRILQQICGQIGNIFQRKTFVHVIFNELDRQKYNSLCEKCNDFCEKNPELQRAIQANLVKVDIINDNFEKAFENNLYEIQNSPALVYLDQNGVKYLSEQYLTQLVNSEKIDFLYFVSSSYYLRFGTTEEFQKNIAFDIEKLKNIDYKRCHIELVKELNLKIPSTSRVRLYPFTIKKNTNIYGIVFGASHPLGVEKFLRVAWKKNPVNGLANFDIDDDELKSGQLDLFGHIERTKIEKFQMDLENKVKTKVLKTNKDVYFHTLMQGHIPEHSQECLKKMKQKGIISYSTRTPYISYDKICKEKKIIEYVVLGY